MKAERFSTERADGRDAGRRPAAVVEALRYHSSLVESMADAVIATDADFRVTLWNPAAERLYGYSVEEAIGRRARELATFEADTSRLELEDELDRTGRAHAVLAARRTDGAFVDVELTVTAVHDDAGAVIGYLGIHRDVTERTRAEAEHRRSEDALRAYRRQIDTIFASITDGFFALDADFRFTYLNARAVQVLGEIGGEPLALDGLLGRDVFTMFPAILGHEAEDSFRRAMRERRTVVYEHRATGRQRWFDVHVYPSEEGLAVYFREVTERKAAEEAQRRQAGQQAAVAERRRIARALQDETLQELDVALTRAATGPDDELVGVLRSVGQQVRAAIYDLRLGDERDGPFRRRVEDMVNLHRGTAPYCEFDVVVRDLPDTLPGDMAAHVLGVIGEALTNARRHAAARRVEVRVGMAGEALVAEVADNGRRLDAERARDATGGHGIAGMRERAGLLGGALEVAPRTGGGTTVELRVPLFAAQAENERVRVLLVDDHAAIREAMALAFAFAEDDGFVVAGQAGTLAEARTMLDGIDVAIVDLRLPDGSGADLIPELQANGSDARALVLSADVDRIGTARAVEKGAAAVLDKSTHLHDVVAAVRRLRAGETLIPLEEVIELLRLAGREREREAEERHLAESLTPREREILQLLAEGLDGRRSAARLHISPRTHRNHVANILAKLGVHSQLQAVVLAVQCGMVDVTRGRVTDVRAAART